jgi:hypothetical protein
VYERRVLAVLVLGVIAWAFTTSWLWHQQRVNTQEAIKRDAAITRQGRIENCRALNELNLELRLALLELGQPVISSRFESTQDCEALP